MPHPDIHQLKEPLLRLLPDMVLVVIGLLGHVEQGDDRWPLWYKGCHTQTIYGSARVTARLVYMYYHSPKFIIHPSMQNYVYLLFVVEIFKSHGVFGLKVKLHAFTPGPSNRLFGDPNRWFLGTCCHQEAPVGGCWH